jgi:hypothetical protein
MSLAHRSHQIGRDASRGKNPRLYQSLVPSRHGSGTRDLEPELRIRVVTAPYFVATKLEAFSGRGRGDYAGSHDLEDLLTVIDGRAAIVQEIANVASLRSYIAEQFLALLKTPAFLDALPGHLLPDPSSQARLPVLRERVEAISSLAA